MRILNHNKATVVALSIAFTSIALAAPPREREQGERYSQRCAPRVERAIRGKAHKQEKRKKRSDNSRAYRRVSEQYGERYGYTQVTTPDRYTQRGR